MADNEMVALLYRASIAPLSKTDEIELAMYKQYKTKSFLDNAIELSKTISEIQTTDAVVKSWQLRIMSLIMKENGEDAPCFDLEFCKENNLIYRIVACTAVICGIEKLKKVFKSLLPGEAFLLQPGIYKIDFPLDKAVTIKGLSETIFFLEDDLQMTADIKLSGIKFVGNKAVEFDKEYAEIYSGFEKQSFIEISDCAKTKFEDCIFDRCTLSIKDEAEVYLSSCEICNVLEGISTADDSVIIFENGIIHDIKTFAISLYGYKEKVKSKLEGLEITNCQGDGISCSVDAEINNCRVHDIIGRGYYIRSFTKSEVVITNCEAYSCCVPEWYLYATVEREKIRIRNAGYIPDLENYYLLNCKEKLRNTLESECLGFDISGENIVLRNCKSFENAAHGFAIGFDFENIVLENCKSFDNAGCGFNIEGEPIITLKDCEAYNNHQGIYLDFNKEDSNKKAVAVFERCKSHNNRNYGFVYKSLISSCSVLFKECEVYENSTFGYSNYRGTMAFEQCKSDHPEDASLFKQYSKPSKRAFIDMVDV